MMVCLAFLNVLFFIVYNTFAIANLSNVIGKKNIILREKKIRILLKTKQFLSDIFLVKGFHLIYNCLSFHK